MEQTLDTNPVGYKDRMYTTARIRQGLGLNLGDGMLPGDLVAVRWWKLEYDVTARKYQPLFYIAKTPDFQRHIAEGTFAVVFKAALEDFVL